MKREERSCGRIVSSREEWFCTLRVQNVTAQGERTDIQVKFDVGILLLLRAVIVRTAFDSIKPRVCQLFTFHQPPCVYRTLCGLHICKTSKHLHLHIIQPQPAILHLRHRGHHQTRHGDKHRHNGCDGREESKYILEARQRVVHLGVVIRCRALVLGSEVFVVWEESPKKATQGDWKQTSRGKSSTK